MQLSRDTILAAQDRKIIPISIPEWGGDCFIRTMSGVQRDAMEKQLLKDSKESSNFRGLLAVFSLCDENGNLLFTEADAKTIGDKSASALDRIVLEAQKLNGLGTGGIEAAGEPLEQDQSANSGLNSP